MPRHLVLHFSVVSGMHSFSKPLSSTMDASLSAGVGASSSGTATERSSRVTRAARGTDGSLQVISRKYIQRELKRSKRSTAGSQFKHEGDLSWSTAATVRMPVRVRRLRIKHNDLEQISQQQPHATLFVAQQATCTLPSTIAYCCTISCCLKYLHASSRQGQSRWCERKLVL